MQFAQARCLADEADALNKNSEEMLRGINWPEGFGDIVKVARQGYSREFDSMAQIGGDSPHFIYPLRQLGEANIEIKQGSRAFETDLGDIAFNQAIREAYPGATYLHIGKVYKVNQWEHGFNRIAIRVAESRNAAPTRSILRKSVTIDLSRQGIIAGRVKKGSNGLLAEAHLQINESVEGYTIGGRQFLYRDERAKNPNMRRKQRDFRTTGIVVQIEEEWFSSTSVRKEVADGLRDLLARERSIAPQDIDSAHTNIALATEAGPQRHITDTAVIYDSVYGGLRLTENLFDEFSRFIERLRLGAQLSNDDGLVSIETAHNLEQWANGLSDDASDAHDKISPEIDVPDGWIRVYKRGSVVGIYYAGALQDRELIEPRYIEDPFNPGILKLYYSYKHERDSEGVNSTPADQIVPVGQDWEFVLWNPETGEFRDLDTPG